ncbi:stage II sporulation protein P [Frisingicoccus sp.]|uniref:stage II sporulation protein P n=1 Tax=Frisingicoccus sp. TaxID=1918627 RepID=UPI003AB86B6A
MGKKLFYLFELVCGILFLWLTGLLTGKNVWLNSMSPVVYGRDVYISVSRIAGSISDGLIGSWAPLWLAERDRAMYAGNDICELYPSDSVLAAVYAENNQSSDSGNDGAGNGGTGAADENSGMESQENTAVQPASAPVASSEGIVYTADMLKDYNYFINQFYAIDSTTYAPDGLLDAENFMNMDLSIDLQGDAPKVLIYHTHSQEAFADSRPGEWQDTVVGLGETLKNNLESRYGVSVLHLTDTFDVIDGVTDRSAAYTYAEEKIWEVLQEYPSIKVVIDLHRDGVADGTRLVTNIGGKDTAQLMFLNGLCRTAANGPIEYLQNPYLTENLAFSFKLQAKAAQYYPDLMRRIYLRSYQYNLHILPRSLLVECGAQTNTVEEVQNAMPLLADLLYLVLSGN